MCVSNLNIIGSDNGLSPYRRQAIIWINAGILLIQTLGTNFSEISSEMHKISFKKMHLKMPSAKWRQYYLGLNVLSERPGELDMTNTVPRCWSSQNKGFNLIQKMNGLDSNNGYLQLYAKLTEWVDHTISKSQAISYPKMNYSRDDISYLIQQWCCRW